MNCNGNLEKFLLAESDSISLAYFTLLSLNFSKIEPPHVRGAYRNYIAQI